MKKLISIILSLLILSSAFTAATVFAADNIYEKGTVLKLSFKAENIDRAFTGAEGALDFGSSLSLNNESVSFPHIGDMEYDITDSRILFDCTNLNNYDLGSDKIFLSAEFTVLEDIKEIPVKCYIDDIYYVKDSEIKEFDNIKLPYTLAVYLNNQPVSEAPETTTPVETTSPSEPDTTYATEADEPSTAYTTAAPATTTDGEATTAATEVTEPLTTDPPAASPEKTSITLKKTSAKLYVKESVKIKSTVINGSGKTSYKSLNDKIAKVNSNGKVTALKKGTTTVSVTNNGATKTFKVTVKNPKLNRTKLKLTKGQIFKLRITGKIGKAVFKSNKKKIASVSKSGKIKANKKGKAVITVKTNGLKIKCRVTVK